MIPTNRARDNQGRFYPEEKDMQNKVKCPECGKVLPVLDIRKTQFCSLVCETNFRYGGKHRDLLTGVKPTSKEVKKW